MTRGDGVDPAVDRVRPLIHDKLREIERSHDLRVLFACESGSRAWGFASDDSDFDVRFIYVRPAADYVRLNPPADAFDLHDGGDFDFAGWDIRKTAELMRKSNAPLLEWLDSPIIYEADSNVYGNLLALRNLYFDTKRSVYPYRGLAGKIFGKYVEAEVEPIRKKYLYALRPLACVAYIQQHSTPAPTSFSATLAALSLPPEVAEAIQRLVTDKQHNQELGCGAADPILNGWIAQMLNKGREFAEQVPPTDVPVDKLNVMVAQAILGPGATS